jgi:hypothetical protein
VLKKISVTLISILLCCLVGGAQASSGDRVKITSVTAAQPVVRGVENEFTVEVEYSLDSADEGELNLGFNAERPNAFRMYDSHIVQKGAGTATLKAKVIPVDWGERAHFMALVNLSRHPHEMRWRPLAGDRQEVQVGQ